MNKLSSISYEKLIKKLWLIGFELYRQGKGSHELWKRDDRVIPIPKHKGKDISKGMLKTILNEIPITIEEFNKL
ncbi:MAG: type II toxin-antitoxin system HicA family toxin [Campylobacterales bacterium]|nr:type II toxin-antitoxin system HicA family toxin [Campylobacterales bacterium]